ncbi:hypothetical protein VFPPC_12677 [Pochonia chlamydosporia 170]|uniref:Effector 5 n=1 Tax=Pochonia chlamydosporia 170 TaxID=1380566 RepID=A0A179G234_METCM|nr:hypothetical protein VFPPC_12677 [Pochonia chlamydosporia 170]OAQ71944.1 hypothetical protein VFPPC_12677 [Pochonia chlamydosporia 170]
MAFFYTAIGSPALLHPSIEKRGFACDTMTQGLTKDDCEYLSSIGMSGQGVNAKSPNGNISVGDQGPNKLIFTNQANKPVILLVWQSIREDFESSFLKVRKPKVSYSLPKQGDKVTVSLANAVSGGWSVVIDRKTQFSSHGQIDNTWGEFTSGENATVNISRLINMSGTRMSARTSGGCMAGMNTCVFVCRSNNTCGESQTYDLKNCKSGSQPGATWGLLVNGKGEENPEGGCQGWKDGGQVSIDLDS